MSRAGFAIRAVVLAALSAHLEDVLRQQPLRMLGWHEACCRGLQGDCPAGAGGLQLSAPARAC